MKIAGELRLAGVSGATEKRIAGELRLAGLGWNTFNHAQQVDERFNPMPCYLFTYHTFGSWMPDRTQGYVRRGQGILPRDPAMAELYWRNAIHEMIEIHAEHQLEAIATLQKAVTHVDCRLHFVSTEPSHVHPLVSWSGPRSWEQNRVSLKRALTLALKETFGKRPWLSEGASRKHVQDQQHFDHLVTQYLPSHGGWKWCEQRGLFR